MAALVSAAETAPEAAFKAKAQVLEKMALAGVQIPPPTRGFRHMQARAAQVVG